MSEPEGSAWWERPQAREPEPEKPLARITGGGEGRSTSEQVAAAAQCLLQWPELHQEMDVPSGGPSCLHAHTSLRVDVGIKPNALSSASNAATSATAGPEAGRRPE